MSKYALYVPYLETVLNDVYGLNKLVLIAFLKQRYFLQNEESKIVWLF